MADTPGWFERLVDSLANSSLFEWIAGHVLVPFWAWRTPVVRQPGGPAFATAPGDNVQRMMNLVMPLKDKTAIGRSKAALAIAANLDEIFAGLDNVGTVHFARFVIVDNNLCMFSAYDGDFTNYIRDFIAQIGSVFDGVVALIEGGDAVIPSEDNIEAFITWVHDHDIYQIPDLATELLYYAPPGGTPAGPDDLRLLPRALILQLDANRNVSLGSGYRGYPGYSVAQIRHQLGLGW
jgi:hypothetical protein